MTDKGTLGISLLLTSKDTKIQKGEAISSRSHSFRCQIHFSCLPSHYSFPKSVIFFQTTSPVLRNLRHPPPGKVLWGEMILQCRGPADKCEVQILSPTSPCPDTSLGDSSVHLGSKAQLIPSPGPCLLANC